MVCLAGCSTFSSVGAGPALIVGNHAREAGLVATAAVGEGTSGVDCPDAPSPAWWPRAPCTIRGSTFTETRARVLVARNHQQLGGLAGLSRLTWVGPSFPLWTGAGIGLGVEHGDDHVFIDAIGQAKLETGFVLHESSSTYSSDFWGGGQPTYPGDARRVRSRRLLTLGLTGDLDARFTRAPLGVVQFTVGLTDLAEDVSVARPRVVRYR